MRINTPSGWQEVAPKKVCVGGVWRDVVSVKVGVGGVWKDTGSAVVEEPPYLYDVEVEYLSNYVVNFTVKKGLPPNEDEAFMFRCVQMPKDGYVARTFSKQWSANGYSKLDCTLADLYGDGIPANNAEMMKTISFQITPRP
jgi:hypothetical protein